MIDVAKELRAEVERAGRIFRSWAEHDASQARGAGKWIRKEILGHLIDSASNNHQRFVRAQFGGAFVWPGYDQNVWVAIHHYRERPWSELVGIWLALNDQVAAVIEHVAPDKLQTPCTIGDEGPKSLEWLMRDYIRHLKHHVGQIEQG